MPGFRSLDTELTGHDLPVEGELPGWLSGTLLRNGPGKFDGGESRLRHWFDGLAMIRKYEFDDGAVTYSNRFLRTDAYDDATAGRPTGQFATDRRGLGKLLGWLKRLGPPEPTDNANVHVARLDGEYVAQTEVPRWVRFTDDLDTAGSFEFADDLDMDMITAHLVADPAGGHVGHGLSFGRTHEYTFFEIPPDSRRREEITSIRTDSPAYIHSIGVSEEHLVLVETPLRINILRALSPFTEGFFELLEWDDELDTRFVVIDRASGETVANQSVDPFFTFHTINAYDDGDGVVLDLVAFEDATIVDALALDTLAEEGFAAAPPGRLVRVRLGTDGSVSRRRLYDGGIELPTVRADRQTRPYRYVYGQSTDREGANGLVKVDTERETATEFWQRDLYVEEPWMVPRPGGEAADDGAVLAPALDVEAERSVLLVLDAATLEELARAPVPHHNPFGFHGRFFSE
ncbi:beta-carotene 15,15'-monooxygenase [Halovenus sp. WSH3]|uniref:Beta-carotene 15,15'-monooxygenase n=2 Tax=Halovenus carboxidivorans TaxID=2692199 RepID=A0A6B0SXQ3_9EURY|nr:carotenoid oxygenase family protein [Halovenus carboxidivorans]MXR50314.1 beta-carotene 15,15'-monooxygenase [Halovenus carboxidivorans]